MIKLLEKIHSSQDSTIKYIFLCHNEYIIEMAYINKNDGKDIICVPSQTSCNMGCKFCHITDVANQLYCMTLLESDICNGVDYIYTDLKLWEDPKVLLISFMGCGEPLENVTEIIETMLRLRKTYDHLPLVRFAIATSLPRKNWNYFFDLTSEIDKYSLQVKMHLSLHYTMDNIRKEWMPSALPIIPALSALEFYKKLTGNSVEIHYALIDGVNDTEQDAILLSELLKNRDIPVKFLFYNEKPTIDFHASSKAKLSIFKKYFDRYGIYEEYYVPPGLDVGASCGQFLLDYYLQYNVFNMSKEHKLSTI